MRLPFAPKTERKQLGKNLRQIQFCAITILFARHSHTFVTAAAAGASFSVGPTSPWQLRVEPNQ